MALNDYEDQIRYFVETENFSCKEIQSVLRFQFGLNRGTSERSIYNFCREKSIHKNDFSLLVRDGMDAITYEAVSACGPTYGRKMLTGVLRSTGLRVGERSVGQSLKTVNPYYSEERNAGRERCTNPAQYYAEYPGHKLHMDQNEKLVMYGVTHVIAVDGFSAKIMTYATMPIKNNLLIYDHVYRPVVTQFGLFDQLRVDYGKEFYLCLYQQDNMSALRTNLNRPPYIQTVSKQNHRVERLWVEINTRVNYPIKRAIQDLVQDDLLDVANEYVKYCISYFACTICSINMRVAVEAWNNHPVPGKGIPNVLFRENCMTAPVPDHAVPLADDVARQYHQDGGHLTLESPFGTDPLERYPHLQQQREWLFDQSFPSLERIAFKIQNRDAQEFCQALMHYIDISFQLLP